MPWLEQKNMVWSPSPIQCEFYSEGKTHLHPWHPIITGLNNLIGFENVQLGGLLSLFWEFFSSVFERSGLAVFFVKNQSHLVKICFLSSPRGIRHQNPTRALRFEYKPSVFQLFHLERHTTAVLSPLLSRPWPFPCLRGDTGMCSERSYMASFGETLR